MGDIHKTSENRPYFKEKDQIKKLKILIAEDDKITKFILKEFTLNLSKEILEVSTGIDAVKICHQNPDIDLVLMDIQMPEMDGYEATRQIRTFNKDVFIIAQTAYALTSDREKAIAAGCNDYISKPFTLAHLIEIINKYFADI